MLRKSAGALLSLLLMAGCGAGAPSTPAGPSGLQDGIPFEKASIQGTITAIGDDGRIRVEEGPEGGSAKALVRITAQTQVRDRNGQAVAEATFVVGMRVRVWYSGPVAESFPVQATAGVVVIDATP